MGLGQEPQVDRRYTGEVVALAAAASPCIHLCGPICVSGPAPPQPEKMWARPSPSVKSTRAIMCSVLERLPLPTLLRRGVPCSFP